MATVLHAEHPTTAPWRLFCWKISPPSPGNRPLPWRAEKRLSPLRSNHAQARINTGFGGKAIFGQNCRFEAEKGRFWGFWSKKRKNQVDLSGAKAETRINTGFVRSRHGKWVAMAWGCGPATWTAAESRHGAPGVESSIFWSSQSQDLVIPPWKT